MRFEMTNEIARIINEDEKVVHEAAADLVAKHYFSQGDVLLDILPPAVRWISKDCLAFIVEKPPKRITVLSSLENLYSIPSPWTVWGIRLNNLMQVEKSYVFARHYPLSTLEDELFMLPLPGVTAGSEVKLPAVRTSRTTLVIERSINAYWGKSIAIGDVATECIPPAWAEHVTGDIDNYLRFLSALSLEDMNFTEFLPSRIKNLESLMEILDPRENTETKTAIEILSGLVKRAAGV